MIENNNFTENKLPKGWAWVSLGNLVDDPKQDLVDGPFGSNLKSCEYQADGIPVLKIQNIKLNRFVDKNIDYISREKADSLVRHSFKSGDLIITKLGAPLGVCCKVPSKYTFGIIVADLMRLRPSKAKVLYDYLLHVINSEVIQKQFKSITKGTTRPRVNLAIVREMQIPFPPLREQHRIVAKIEELFSELDKGVEALKTAQQQLKVYRQAVLKWAFEGKLTEEWRKQQKNLPTASQLLEQIKTEREKSVKLAGKKLKTVTSLTEAELVKLPKLPNGWNWMKLAEVSIDVFDGPFGSHLKSNDYVDDGVRVIRLENIGPLKFKDQYKSYVTKEKHETIKKHTVYPGDIVFSSFISEEIRVSIVPPYIQKAVNKADCFCIRTDNSMIGEKYLACFLSTKTAYHQLVNEIHGATRPRINTTQLKYCCIPYCSVEEQNKITQEIETRLSVADKVEETISQSLQQAEALRQSIFKKAFAGKLVPQDPNDEPASKLLERIKAERAAQATVKRAQ